MIKRIVSFFIALAMATSLFPVTVSASPTLVYAWQEGTVVHFVVDGAAPTEVFEDAFVLDVNAGDSMLAGVPNVAFVHSAGAWIFDIGISLGTVVGGALNPNIHMDLALNLGGGDWQRVRIGLPPGTAAPTPEVVMAQLETTGTWVEFTVVDIPPNTERILVEIERREPWYMPLVAATFAPPDGNTYFGTTFTGRINALERLPISANYANPIGYVGGYDPDHFFIALRNFSGYVAGERIGERRIGPGAVWAPDEFVITVTGPATSVIQNTTTQPFTAEVTLGGYSGGVSQNVTWSTSHGMIQQNGRLSVPHTIPAGTLITVTATSNDYTDDHDAPVFGTQTISVLPARTVVHEPVLTVSSTFANPGARGTAYVTLRLDNNPGVAAMLMRLSFSDYLTLTAYDFGRPDISDADFDDLEYGFNAPLLGSDDSFFGWIERVTDMVQSGLFITLTFDVYENAPKEAFLPVEITFEDYVAGPTPPTNAVPEYVSIAIVNGGVLIQPYLLGDASGDGRTTSSDATLLAQYLVGHDVIIDRRAMDLNGDGHVDGADIYYLVRWLLGRGLPYVMGGPPANA